MPAFLEANRFWEDRPPARDAPCGNPRKSLTYIVHQFLAMPESKAKTHRLSHRFPLFSPALFDFWILILPGTGIVAYIPERESGS